MAHPLIENTLIEQGGRIYRAYIGRDSFHIVTAQGRQEVNAAKVRPVHNAATYHSAFDEWADLSREQKAARIRAAVHFNPQMGWRVGAMDRLIANMPIFDHCVVETGLLVRRGIKHYACRTILEVARHHTTLHMIDNTYKINNNLIPDLARLLTVMFPEIPQRFFDLRGNGQRGAAA